MEIENYMSKDIGCQNYILHMIETMFLIVFSNLPEVHRKHVAHLFGPWVYQRGSLVIALVCWSVSWFVRRPIFGYFWDPSKDFYNFLHEVRAPRVQKWHSPIFEKKYWWVTNRGKAPFLVHFWCLLSISQRWNFVLK